MKALKFKEQNVVFAKDQSEYISLPAHRFDDAEGTVVFCMGLSFRERIRILFTGKMWIGLLMFGKSLTPSRYSTKKSEFFN